MTFPTEAEWVAAVKAVLASVNAAPYDYGAIVPSGVSAYNYVSVTDRATGVRRMSSEIGTRSVRIAVLSVGLASPAKPLTPTDNAREMRRRADVLRGLRLTIGDQVTTPIQAEPANPIRQDGSVLIAGNWFSGLTAYTAVI